MGILIAFSAVMGWCGTPFPYWWWIILKRKGNPPPPPPPDWLQGRLASNPMPGIIIAGIAGGVAGGLLMNALVEHNLVLSGMAAFGGGRILADITGAIRSAGK
ncbi:MAG: hypothetical protein QM731_01580 [Chitinophagaceae bacterium]